MTLLYDDILGWIIINRRGDICMPANDPYTATTLYEWLTTMRQGVAQSLTYQEPISRQAMVGALDRLETLIRPIEAVLTLLNAYLAEHPEHDPGDHRVFQAKEQLETLRGSPIVKQLRER